MTVMPAPDNDAGHANGERSHTTRENAITPPGTDPVRDEPPTIVGAASGEAPRYDQHNHGPGQAYQAAYLYVTNSYNGECVREHPVPEADLIVSTDARYVPPRDNDRLKQAERCLAAYGVVVLSAAPGSGRRTTALRLLSTAAVEPFGPPLELVDLEPEWSEVRVGQLPKLTGRGYVLDLTELPTEEPHERMRALLSDYGREGVSKGWRLVILAAPQTWRGRWLDAAADFVVPLPSPDARNLAKRELAAHDATDRVAWVDHEVFSDIWASNPPAHEACRLARIVVDAKHPFGRVPDREFLARILDEFQGWRDHIERLLNEEPRGQGQPSLLANRATVWAGALLHGGEPRSVLKAADTLMGTLEIPRAPRDVLGDATSSQRLDAASLTPRGGHIFHDEDKHALAPAILDNLWTEFPTQRSLCNTWAVSVAADPDIPEDDARIVTHRLLHLATTRHDGAILDALATGLEGSRRQLATDALTTAALDPNIGAYVRQRLYTWSRKASSSHTLQLVIAVCGGPLGRAEPGIALTRLRWATERSPLGTPSAVRAFKTLIIEHPTEVRAATRSWFDKVDLNETLSVFFAIASSDEGAALLLNEVDDDTGRDRFVRAWQQLLLKEDSREVVDQQITRWGELADQDFLPGRSWSTCSPMCTSRTSSGEASTGSTTTALAFWTPSGDTCSARRSSAASSAAKGNWRAGHETTSLAVSAHPHHMHVALSDTGHPVHRGGQGHVRAVRRAAGQGPGGRERRGPARARHARRVRHQSTPSG
ncbi:hypothetical protein J4032_00105 [Streptomyces formicae]|uniref:Uncharacterized protein n=1 Tax=Streptomyces formicae TaxID=1616117 RepID=A0ABY3WC20_9ACTN|nr:hypothetical protein [Streptomyces formicae]UNM10123.1 hypothetical protein J4032_00105 [Streptomyces formicae]